MMADFYTYLDNELSKVKIILEAEGYDVALEHDNIFLYTDSTRTSFYRICIESTFLNKLKPGRPMVTMYHPRTFTLGGADDTTRSILTSSTHLLELVGKGAKKRLV